MQSKPLKIGITGGIGSGKTIVCKIFKLLGIPVYYADLRAKEIIITDQQVVKSIKNLFGIEAYFDNGEFNRDFVARNVFSDKEKLNALNNLVHPVVASDFESWVKSHKTKPYLIKEAALLVESGSYKSLDYLITVSAPKDLRIKRVMTRDKHRTKQDVEDIISKQISEEQKIGKSQFVIVNDDHTLLIPQVLKINEKLISSNHVG